MLTHSFHSPNNRRQMLILIVAGLISLLCLGGVVAATAVPEAGAQGAQVLRGFIGDQAVAQLETIIYQAQDFVQQWSYRAGVTHPAAPWAVTPALGAQAPIAVPTATPIPATPIWATP